MWIKWNLCRGSAWVSLKLLHSSQWGINSDAQCQYAEMSAIALLKVWEEQSTLIIFLWSAQSIESDGSWMGSTLENSTMYFSPYRKESNPRSLTEHSDASKPQRRVKPRSASNHHRREGERRGGAQQSPWVCLNPTKEKPSQKNPLEPSRAPMIIFWTYTVYSERHYSV